MRKTIALLVVVLVVSVALAGCAAPKPQAAEQPSQAGAPVPNAEPGSIVGEAKDNAAVVTCRTNRAQIDQLMAMAQSAGSTPADFATVLEQSRAKCPSGGTYSWDSAAGKTRCSIHGE